MCFLCKSTENVNNTICVKSCFKNDLNSYLKQFCLVKYLLNEFKQFICLNDIVYFFNFFECRFFKTQIRKI